MVESMPNVYERHDQRFKKKKEQVDPKGDPKPATQQVSICSTPEVITEQETQRDHIPMELTNDTMSRLLSHELDIAFDEPYLHGTIIKGGVDCLQGAFPDYYLPVPGNVKVSQAFFGYTEILSLSNNKMTLLKLPQMQATYDTEIYGIDQVNGVLYAVYPVGMRQLKIRGRVEKDGPPPVMPKPFQSMLLSSVAPQPQATSTPAVGTASASLSGTVSNERTITSVPREDQQVSKKKGIDVENLSNATSISRLSVDDPLYIEEMEYIEAQRHQQKVRIN